MAKETQFQCPCGTVVTAVVPPPSFVNRIGFTIIVFTHEEVARCPNCRQAYVYAINGIGITEGGFIAAEVPEEKSIVAPPSGFDPTKWKQ
jgi:hypothetical protein